MDKKASLLLVEDDVNLSFVTRDNLEEHGYKVTWAADGEQALALLEEKQFDLCILDVMLPLMDGFTLAQRLRENNKEIPVIFLSARSLKEDKIHGLKIGGDDYITKPFSIEELVLKVEIFLKRRHLAGAENTSEGIYKIGAYAFDYKNLRLIHEEKVTSLTGREAELLRLFCMKPGTILKREEILKQVWGNDDYFSGRSLDVFISRLRKYLKQDKNTVIENIHGVGFRITGVI